VAVVDKSGPYTFSVWMEFTVVTVVVTVRGGGHTRGIPERNDIGSHAWLSFKRGKRVKLNGILECKYLIGNEIIVQ
jgi:hypothetical protein